MKNSLGSRVKIQMGLESEEERTKRIEREKKSNESVKKYFDSLEEKNKPKPITEIPTTWMKKQIWVEGQKYQAKQNRYFDVDDENKLFLDLISKYFANDTEFEKQTNGELRKGLLIYGPCGTGKSSIFDIVRIISLKYNLKQIYFKNTSVHKVINEFNKESKSNQKFGGELVVEKYSRGVIHFDDLGTEKLVNDFGIKEDLFDRLLQVRYNNYKESGQKTFVTTNKTIQEIEKRYSPQVKSRLYEMFNMIPLTGNDRRF